MKEKLFALMLLACVLGVSVGRLYGSSLVTADPSDTQSTPTHQTNETQLEVRPAQGSPVPLGEYELQGSQQQQQQAEGGLQEQQSQPLQPNAQADLFSDE